MWMLRLTIVASVLSLTSCEPCSDGLTRCGVAQQTMMEKNLQGEEDESKKIVCRASADFIKCLHGLKGCENDESVKSAIDAIERSLKYNDCNVSGSTIVTTSGILVILMFLVSKMAT
ncbi:Uncharacterised protein g7332 [Pycnogonum litorale]